MSLNSESIAFVLRARPYGESDRIVTFITEDHGKVSGIAKGAMRSRRRFVNTLEPFVKVRIAFRTRPRSELAFIERADLVQVLPGFGSDLDRFACGSYVLELTDQMIMGREPGDEIFRLVETALSTLDTVGPSMALLRGFELHMLEAIGYRPELERCRSCGASASGQTTVAVVPARGGVFCPRCRPASEAADTLSGGALELLMEIQASPLGAAVRSVSEEEETTIEAAVEGLIGHVITRPLRSRGVLSALRQAAPAC